MSTATAQVFTLPEREFQQAIGEMVARGEYRRVLEAVRFARERDPKNIFLIAIDRQVRRLEEMVASDDPEITERTKTEESLAQLVQRAWADATTRGVVLVLPADLAPAQPSIQANDVRRSASPPPAGPEAAPDPGPVAQQPPVHHAPVQPAQPGRRIPLTVIAAAVLTLAVIGMAVTYFMTRKPEVPQGITVVSSLPPAPAVQENPEVPSAAEGKTPAVEAPKSSVRERTPSPPEKPASRTERPKDPSKEPAKVLPPAGERTAPAQETQAVAGAMPVPATEAPAATESAQPFIPVQKEPRVIRLVEPELNEAALRHGKEGEIIARVLIGTDGKPLKVRIVKSSNTFLNKAVAEALLRSEYEPGVMTVGPVQSWLTVPFKFR